MWKYISVSRIVFRYHLINNYNAILKYCKWDRELFFLFSPAYIPKTNFLFFFFCLQQSYEYDIAVLRMVRKVNFQPNVIPICLPTSSSDLVGRTGSVTGWGRRSEYGQISPILREVHLPIISNEKCMQMYRLSGQNEWIPKIFLCAGTANGGADSCEGDSGGPLVVKGSNGRYTLAGIISWGIGCGDRNRPGVYTRISEFKNWIIRNTNYRRRWLL